MLVEIDHWAGAALSILCQEFKKIKGSGADLIISLSFLKVKASHLASLAFLLIREVTVR